jgi:bloom syndrome protein
LCSTDFRPDYLRLAELKGDFPTVPILALTATATPSVQEDVIRVLRLQNCVRFQQSFNRHNLRYSVLKKGTKCVEEIANLINTQFVERCGIVYCSSKADCEKVSAALCDRGIVSQYYHAGLDEVSRENIQNSWSNDEFPVICATIAFGMGIVSIF